MFSCWCTGCDHKKRYNMEDVKKVLIMPSWYPAKDNPLTGIFFQEQAQLLDELYDVRIFIGRQKENKIIYRILSTLFFIISKISIVNKSKEFYITPPYVYEFIFQKLYFMNYYNRIHSYLNYFEKNIYPYWKPDLLHAHDTLMGGVCAQAISEKYNIPYIITEHNYLLFDRSDLFNSKMKNALNNARAVLLVSEYQKRILALRDIGRKIIISGNYVNEEKYKISHNKERKQFRILFVARNAHHKDINTLMNTIMTFVDMIKNKDYEFIIIGFDVNLWIIKYPELINLIKQKKITNLLNVSREEIVDYFQDADVLLSTSIAETFGVTICEAMMCGVPVVSTNSGGFDEMYIEGVNGMKCSIGDFKGIAKSLEMIYSKEVYFTPIKIRESVVNKFGKIGFQEKIMKIYDGVIDGQ